MRTQLLLIVVGQLITLSLPLHAQTPLQSDFRLFEDVEADTQRTQPVRPANQRGGRTEAKPEFTLLGTSRIGDSYHAILADSAGRAVVVSTKPNSSSSIPGHIGYSLLDVGSRRASVKYPDDVPCVEYTDQGVKCSGTGNIALLGLANAAPLPPRKDDQEVLTETAPVDQVVDGEQQAPPTNPFAALRAINEANGNNPPADNPAQRGFQVRRIDPADVPAGMRVVSTPFGDRLVED